MSINPYKSRMPENERKAIIEAYKNGTLDSSKYEVHTYKNKPDKYYIHKITNGNEIKNNLPKINNNTVTNNTVNNNEVNEQDNNIIIEGENPNEENNTQIEEYNPFNDPRMYYPRSKMTKSTMFREMQMMMNSMFLEQFKLLRQNTKESEKKRKKLAEKTNAMYRSISNFVAEPDEENNKEIIEENNKEIIDNKGVLNEQPILNETKEINNETPINNNPISSSGFKKRVFNPV
jgi:hypothetical protein